MNDQKQSPDITPENAAASHGKARADLNQQIEKRQKLLLAGVGGLALIGGTWFIFSDGEDGADQDADGAATIETGSLVNRNLSQREFVASYQNRLNAVIRDQKKLEESQLTPQDLEEELDKLRAENSQMRSDGQTAIDAISTENDALKKELAAAKAAPPAPQIPAYGRGEADFQRQASSLGNPDGPAAAPLTGEDGLPAGKVKILEFSSKGKPSKKTAVKPDISPLLLEDSKDYLPPNSYAPARVIVGVDASVGVASQSDPLPVVLRITGPARSVVKNGKVLTTDIKGCVVNGAARGDLSAEKVYVKLARMTCNQPGGRVAVSEVKGFISFAGKSGVRGRVVSREGSLVSQALLAGIVGGFGRGFSANANSIFTGQIGSDGRRENLSAGDIITGGLGQGGADAADTVSKYLIERAEQYQPVIEMPTGIDVEIVFLDGVHVRRSDK